MDYYRMEDCLQVLFKRFIPLSEAQRRRLQEICRAVLLAGEVTLTGIAKWIRQDSHQGSRVQWLRRTLTGDYLCWERVYQPFVREALRKHHVPVLHLIMDRTHLEYQKSDLLMLSLNCRYRAIPLIWQFVPYGSTGYETQIALIERVQGILPADIPIVFHGDSEFGAVRLMQYLTYLNWDYMLGQRSAKHYRQGHSGSWQALNTVPVSKS